MSDRISVDGLTNAVMDRLEEYKDLAVDEMKTAVKEAGETVVAEISKNAPRRPGSGRYAGSWVSKTTAETSSDIQVTVHSPSQYRIAHLLENGHAKRGGGRVDGRPHIAPAEEAGEKQLEENLSKVLKG